VLPAPHHAHHRIGITVPCHALVRAYGGAPFTLMPACRANPFGDGAQATGSYSVTDRNRISRIVLAIPNVAAMS